MRAFAFGHFEGIDHVELRDGDKIVGGLKLQTSQLRAAIPVASRRITFGVPAGDSFRVLGRVALPEEGVDFILVFVPVENGYRAFPVRADDPDFRGDDKFVFNFSKYHLAILLGESRNRVEPWGSKRLRPKFDKDAHFYRAMFTYDRDGKLAVFSNTRWRVNPNTKSLIFVYHDEALDRMTYRSVIELARR